MSSAIGPRQSLSGFNGPRSSSSPTSSSAVGAPAVAVPRSGGLPWLAVGGAWGRNPPPCGSPLIPKYARTSTSIPSPLPDFFWSFTERSLKYVPADAHPMEVEQLGNQPNRTVSRYENSSSFSAKFHMRDDDVPGLGGTAVTRLFDQIAVKSLGTIRSHISRYLAWKPTS